ncbi:MAG: hypothetical protein ABL962_13620 [Fimbriimonadaceae bacterium]
MKLARNILSGLAFVLLGLGYLGSHWFQSNGSPAAWAFAIDQPPIRMIAWILLVGAIVLSFSQGQEEETS